MSGRLLEAIERGLWEAPSDAGAELQRAYLEADTARARTERVAGR